MKKIEQAAGPIAAISLGLLAAILLLLGCTSHQLVESKTTSEPHFHPGVGMVTPKSVNQKIDSILNRTISIDSIRVDDNGNVYIN